MMEKLSEDGKTFTYAFDGTKLRGQLEQVNDLVHRITTGPHEGLVVLQILLDIYKQECGVHAVTQVTEAQA